MVDYFIVSKSLKKDLCAFRMFDNLVNLSDHLPINIVIRIPLLESNTTLGKHAIPLVKSAKAQNQRLRWDHANLADYYSLSNIVLQPIMATVDELLEQLLTSSQYNTYSEKKCYRNQLTEARPMAINVIEDVYSKIITTLSDTATQTIPTMHPMTLKHWWNDELESLKDNARSSHNAWFTVGKPNTGMLWETKKHDKYLVIMLAIKKF